MPYVHCILLNEFNGLFDLKIRKCDAFPVFDLVHYPMLSTDNSKKDNKIIIK